MEISIEHKIFNEHNELKMSLTNSCWYDTATPAQWCANRLAELKEEIKNGEILKIESKGNIYPILNLDDFKNWVINEFKGGFENIFDQ